MAKKSKKWIQKAIKKPGSFTARCKRKGFGWVTQACINAGKKSSNPTIKKRAVLAETLRKMSKKRKRRK